MFRPTETSSATPSDLTRAFKRTCGENFYKTKTVGNEKRLGSNNEIENEPSNAFGKATEAPAEILFNDLVQILEVNSLTKKMIHAPSLSVFILKTVSINAEKDKKRLYSVLNLWKKLAAAIPEHLIDFQNIFYYSNLDIVQICLNQTGLFPLKVDSPDICGHSPVRGDSTDQARRFFPPGHLQAGEEARTDLQADPPQILVP
jgi:hypothetical protein